MKKAQIVEIAKQSFYIQEDAYKQLNGYLKKISSHYEDQEIVDDIERSIAEKLRAALTDENSVVTESDVETVISQLGSIKEITGESDSEDPDQESVESATVGRRLFRDTEHGEVAGVSAGIAAYFSIDVVIIRILFIIVTLFVSGFGILIYIILALVVPEAKTVEDKQRMRGAEGTLKGIEANVKQRTGELKKEHRGTVVRIGNRLIGISFSLLRLLIKIIGALMIIIGTIASAATIAFAVAFMANANNSEILGELELNADGLQAGDYAMIVAMAAVLITFSIFVIYIGAALITSYRKLKALPLIVIITVLLAASFSAAIIAAFNADRWEEIDRREYSTVTKTIDGDFRSISIEDSIRVDIVDRAGESEVVVRDSDDSNIIYFVEKGTLHIESSSEFSFCWFGSCSWDEKIVVYVDELDSLVSSGQADVSVNGDFKIDSVETSGQAVVRVVGDFTVNEVVASGQSSIGLTYEMTNSSTLMIYQSNQSHVNVHCESLGYLDAKLEHQASLTFQDCKVEGVYTTANQSGVKGYSGTFNELD